MALSSLIFRDTMDPKSYVLERDNKRIGLLLWHDIMRIQLNDGEYLNVNELRDVVWKMDEIIDNGWSKYPTDKGKSTDRGFELIEFTDANDVACSLQQSSAVGNYDDAMERPGTVITTRR